MAVASPSSLETLDPKSEKPDPSSENPNPNLDPAPSQPENPNPDPSIPAPAPAVNPSPTLLTPPPPPPPSFRPLGAPPMPMLQYSAIPNPSPAISYAQNPSPGIQPPGVSAPPSYMVPGVAPGAAGAATVSAPPMMYQPPPMPYAPNGYMALPPGVPPHGIPRYPGPYPPMVRPGFPPRPPPMGMIPQVPRPPIPGIRGIPPVVTPIVRPVVPAVAATEKPQTTVYISKIAATVDNDFLLSLLRLCGPVKSWKRAQDPTNGSFKSFGFCEFEAAEGILRALRLLTKLKIDGQELALKINDATREYLERYVEKKSEREKLKETENQTGGKENEGEPNVEKQEPENPAVGETKKDSEDSGDKENQDNQKFGIVTDEDREIDKITLEKITSMIEERLKKKPLPPPPVHLPVDTSAKASSEVPSKSRDGDSDIDIMKSAEDKNDDETTSETKPSAEHDKSDTNSPDRGWKHDRSSRERERDRDSKREKERDIERYERERERERVRREKERDMKIREAERLYSIRLKDWEAREREKEHQRLKEKEREKERQRERRREIVKDEDGSDDDEDDSRKRRRRSSTLEEKRRKRRREKEEDLADRLKEEEEIEEAKKRAIEEQKQIEERKSRPNQVTEEIETAAMEVDDMPVEGKDAGVVQQTSGIVSDDLDPRNNIVGGSTVASSTPSYSKQINDVPAKKLGFGLVGSGKKTTVPSVFHEEDDENVVEKKMRPLVPIDYSTEELQAVQTSVSSTPANLVAAAEYAKRISGVNVKEEKPETERERNGRSNDRGGHRDRDRNDDDNTRYRHESKDKVRDRGYEKERDRDDKPKSENKKLLDAKQLIDMIPKTKEELFAYEINWAVYDKHELHENMRPWISKKITEFLGEEEETLVDYIVSSTKDHVRASKMLELLQSILDDEAEMFVLKMWRMLIYEIKRVEAGLPTKSRA